MCLSESKIKYYQLLIQDNYNNDRFLSSSVYSDTELNINDIKVLLKREYFLRNPDEKLLFVTHTEEILDKLKLIDKIKIN